MKNQDLNFQTHRSRRLLGVRSSDWYQNEAEVFYFYVLELVFETNTSTFLYFGKYVVENDEKLTFSVAG